MIYLITIDVFFYQVNILMIIDVQITNLTFVDNKMIYVYI